VKQNRKYRTAQFFSYWNLNRREAIGVSALHVF